MMSVHAITPCQSIKLKFTTGNSYINLPKEFFGIYKIIYEGEDLVHSAVNRPQYSSGFYQYYPKGTLLYGNIQKEQIVEVSHSWYKTIYVKDVQTGRRLFEANLLKNKYGNLEFQIWSERGVVTALRPDGNNPITNMVEYEFYPAALINYPKKRIKISGFYLEKV